MVEFIDKWVGEIVLAVGTSVVLGVWGLIWSFFRGIKKLHTKVTELELKLEENTRSDADLKDWINTLIKQNMK